MPKKPIKKSIDKLKKPTKSKKLTAKEKNKKLNLPKIVSTKAKRKTKSKNLITNSKISAQKIKAVKQIKEGYEQLGKGLTDFIKSY